VSKSVHPSVQSASPGAQLEVAPPVAVALPPDPLAPPAPTTEPPVPETAPLDAPPVSPRMPEVAPVPYGSSPSRSGSWVREHAERPSAPATRM